MNKHSTTTLFRREMSVPDLGYAAAGSRIQDNHQVIIQYVVEGQGIIDENALRKAVEKVAIATPACRMVIRGRWGFKHWRADGPLPAIKVIQHSWDGYYCENLDFLDGPLDLFTGPVVEIIQVVSAKTYLIFRIHHAVMDGVAATEFIQNFFRALKGEALENHHSNMIAETLPLGNPAPKTPPKRVEALSPLRVPEAADFSHRHQRVWHRISVRGNDLLMLPKIMIALSQIARKSASGTVRMRVLVSLRRHVPHEKTSANLIGVMYLDIEETETARTLVKKFNQKLADKCELWSRGPSAEILLIKWLPLFFLQAIGRLIINANFNPQRFLSSGTISSGGIIDLKNYSIENFSAQSVFGIPIPYTTPLFVAICGNEKNTEITVGAPRHLASNNQLIELCNELQSRLNC